MDSGNPRDRDSSLVQMDNDDVSNDGPVSDNARDHQSFSIDDNVVSNRNDDSISVIPHDEDPLALGDGQLSIINDNPFEENPRDEHTYHVRFVDNLNVSDRNDGSVSVIRHNEDPSAFGDGQLSIINDNPVDEIPHTQHTFFIQYEDNDVSDRVGGSGDTSVGGGNSDIIMEVLVSGAAPRYRAWVYDNIIAPSRHYSRRGTAEQVTPTTSNIPPQVEVERENFYTFEPPGYDFEWWEDSDVDDYEYSGDEGENSETEEVKLSVHNDELTEKTLEEELSGQENSSNSDQESTESSKEDENPTSNISPELH